MSMIVSPFSVTSLVMNEAEISNGKVISFGVNSLPPAVKASLQDELKKMGISEKEYEGRVTSELDVANDVVPKPRSSDTSSAIDKPFSIHGNDVIDGQIMHELEFYDKSIDEAILASDDIVKAYNAVIDAKFEEALKLAKKQKELNEKYKDSDVEISKIRSQKDVKSFVNAKIHRGYTIPIDIINELTQDIGQMKEMLGITDSDIKKMVCEAVYRPSDDPEEIKRIVNARIKYNNTVIAFFKSMLQINYNVLGLTKDEAIALSGKLSSPSQHQNHKAIKDVKEVIVKNANKYKIGKASYDFRPLGMGCMFMTDEDMGPIKSTVDLDRMIQMLTQYDAIVVGHGGSRSKEFDRAAVAAIKEYDSIEERNRKEERKVVGAMEDEINKLVDDEVSKTPEGKIMVDKLRELKKRADRSYYQTDEYKQLHKIWLDIVQDESLPWEERTKKMREIEEQEDKGYANYDKIRDDLYAEHKKLHQEFTEKYGSSARQKIYRGETDNERANEIGKKYDSTLKHYADKIHNEQKEQQKAITKLYKKMRKEDKVSWTIQPIHTLNAGPFTDVNDLVRQLIKEGFKNINLISCNPGGHTLAKDIQDAPGVKIHHATRSLIAESATYYNSGDIMVESAFVEIDKTLMETQQHLISICNESGIRFNDDEYLNECVAFFESDSIQETLTEGVLSTAWSKLKELISKALGFIVGIFKKIISLFANIIRKIKEFFKKIFASDRVNNKIAKPITSGVIMVENARINTTKVTSWEDLQKNIVNACEKISKKISETERKQTSNMQELEKYAEQQSKKVNESANPQFDQLCSLFW